MSDYKLLFFLAIGFFFYFEPLSISKKFNKKLCVSKLIILITYALVELSIDQNQVQSLRSRIEDHDISHDKTRDSIPTVIVA